MSNDATDIETPLTSAVGIGVHITHWQQGSASVPTLFHPHWFPQSQYSCRICSPFILRFAVRPFVNPFRYVSWADLPPIRLDFSEFSFRERGIYAVLSRWDFWCSPGENIPHFRCGRCRTVLFSSCLGRLRLLPMCCGARDFG